MLRRLPFWQWVVIFIHNEEKNKLASLSPSTEPVNPWRGDRSCSGGSQEFIIRPKKYNNKGYFWQSILWCIPNQIESVSTHTRHRWQSDNLFTEKWKLDLGIEEALSILSGPRNPRKLSKQLSLPNDKDSLDVRGHFHQLGTFLAPPRPNKRNVGLFRKGIRYFYYPFLFCKKKVKRRAQNLFVFQQFTNFLRLDV